MTCSCPRGYPSNLAAKAHTAKCELLPKRRERPILFSGSMVRAILEGRKTQTRRVGNFRGADKVDWHVGETHWWKGKPPEKYEGWVAEVVGLGLLLPLKCPFGAVGDLLWVRETWQRLTGNGHRIVYRADLDPPMTGDGTVSVQPMSWRPSIYLRREHSRITLEVTDVRVERLQDISEEDAKAEGVAGIVSQTETGPRVVAYQANDKDLWVVPSAREGFKGLWNSINAKRAPWESNPWVWAISFRRVTP